MRGPRHLAFAERRFGPPRVRASLRIAIALASLTTFYQCGGGGSGGAIVGNSSFEDDTLGWNTEREPAVLVTRVPGGHTGSFAARLENNGAPSGECKLNDSPNWVTTSSARTYVGSIWARADVAGATLNLRFREYDDQGILVGINTAILTLTTEWQLVSVSYDPVAPGRSTLDFNAYVSDAALGTCFYADDASITVGEPPTPTAAPTSSAA
jgi:hypothetical protein